MPGSLDYFEVYNLEARREICRSGVIFVIIDTGVG
jgi:hypothetical protein